MTPEDLIANLPPLGGVLREALNQCRLSPTSTVEDDLNAAALAVAKVVVEHVLKELEKQEPMAWQYALWFGDECVREIASCGRLNFPFGRQGIDFSNEARLEEQPLYAAPHPRNEA